MRYTLDKFDPSRKFVVAKPLRWRGADLPTGHSFSPEIEQCPALRLKALYLGRWLKCAPAPKDQPTKRPPGISRRERRKRTRDGSTTH